MLDITDLEIPRGVIVSTGGQIPNNLAMRLQSQHVPILGTSATDIDHAEDRHKFSAMLDEIGVDQPLLAGTHDNGRYLPFRRRGGIPRADPSELRTLGRGDERRARTAPSWSTS